MTKSHATRGAVRAPFLFSILLMMAACGADGKKNPVDEAAPPVKCASGEPTTFYVDSDGDGFGNPAVTTVACAAPPNHADKGRDCDDSNAARKPGSCAPTVPGALVPENGAYTGSIHSPLTGAPPLRPEFRWAATAGAQTYEIQIDDACVNGAIAACAFQDPRYSGAVTTTSFLPTQNLAASKEAPVGRRYFWRVRACFEAECSAWTSVRYLEVGRMKKDFNGDGYADVVVGADGVNGDNTDEGRAYVYLGGVTGPSGAPVALAPPMAGARNAHFGNSVASAGDVNGDGYADLVVGARQATGDASESGKAFVYLGGGGTSPLSGMPIALAPLMGQANGWFGHSVAGAGDVNADGYADLVVGAPGPANTPGAGGAYVYLGGAAGPQSGAPVVLQAQDDKGAQFGESVATAGDVNGDGYADLVVGAPNFDPGGAESFAGRAYLYLGGGTNPLGAASPLVPPKNHAGSKFGASVAAAGDTNRDGYADLVIGAPEADADGVAKAGRAYLYLGGGTSPWSGAPLALAPVMDRPAAKFGASVATAGDVNGDGYTDLIVGAPTSDADAKPEAGSAYLYLGGSTNQLSSVPIPLAASPNQEDAFFGDSVAGAGDINGDGYADLVVGASGFTLVGKANVGRAFIYLGGGSSPLSVAPLLLAPAAAMDQASAKFGSSVASAGDVKRDSRRDPVVRRGWEET